MSHEDVGMWCSQLCKHCGNISLCEHNLSDASINQMDVCTEHGGKCNKGDRFNHNCKPRINKIIEQPNMNGFHKQQKLTMQKLVDLKDKKVYDSIYIKCYLCGQFKPAKEGVLVESDLTIDVDFESTTNLFKQVFEVICEGCVKLMEGKHDTIPET